MSKAVVSVNFPSQQVAALVSYTTVCSTHYNKYATDQPLLPFVPQVACASIELHCQVPGADTDSSCVVSNTLHGTCVHVAGDINAIVIGDKTNIQDNVTVHVARHSFGSGGAQPTIIGSAVTIGHGATLHACKIGDGCLVRAGGCVALVVHAFLQLHLQKCKSGAPA